MNNHTHHKQRHAYLSLLLLIALTVTSLACTHATTLTLDDNPKAHTVQSTQPQTIHGRVIRILDGDTIEIIDSTDTTYRIRLEGIDAPEKSQAFGTKARQQLATFAFNHDATIEWNEKDLYGRIVGKLLVDGKDIGLEMIRSGLAWHFKRYENNQAETDRIAYAEAEQQSRKEQLGLWSDPNPTPPWTFRHQRSQKEPSH